MNSAIIPPDKPVIFWIETSVGCCRSCGIPVVDALARDGRVVMVSKPPEMEEDGHRLRHLDHPDFVCFSCAMGDREREMYQDENTKQCE